MWELAKARATHRKGGAPCQDHTRDSGVRHLRSGRGHTCSASRQARRRAIPAGRSRGGDHAAPLPVWRCLSGTAGPLTVDAGLQAVLLVVGAIRLGESPSICVATGAGALMLVSALGSRVVEEPPSVHSHELWPYRTFETWVVTQTSHLRFQRPRRGERP